MPLKLKIKPNERMIINGVSVRNGDRSTTLIIETGNAKILRETDIILESEADTPAKRLYVTLMVVHLADNPGEAIELFYAQSAELLKINPSAAPHLLAIRDELDARQFYNALKACRALIEMDAGRAKSRPPAANHVQIAQTTSASQTRSTATEDDADEDAESKEMSPEDARTATREHLKARFVGNPKDLCIYGEMEEFLQGLRSSGRISDQTWVDLINDYNDMDLRVYISSPTERMAHAITQATRL